VACETGFLRACREEQLLGTEKKAEKRHSKIATYHGGPAWHSTTQPRKGPGRQAHMGNHNKRLLQ
jgi:hypothetical protein